MGFDRKQVQTAVPKVTTSTRQQFASLFNFEPLEIKGIGDQPAKYSQTLIKSCDVQVHFDEVSTLKNTDSGFIAIPKFVKQLVTEIATPPCYVTEDRTFRLGAFVPTAVAKSEDIAKSIALSKKADDARDLEERRYALAEDNAKKLMAKARESQNTRHSNLRLKPVSKICCEADFVRTQLRWRQCSE